MIGLNGKVRIFLYAGTCDMRRQIAGLATMVREELGRDPQCGDLYVFVAGAVASRRRCRSATYEDCVKGRQQAPSEGEHALDATRSRWP